MTITPTLAPIAPGSDCSSAFQAAYENRYTWDPGFGGYQGRCIWENGERRLEGRFQVGADLKAQVEGIEDEAVHKEIAGQLWEVAIHRVRRSFQQTHGITPTALLRCRRADPGCWWSGSSRPNPRAGGCSASRTSAHCRPQAEPKTQKAEVSPDQQACPPDHHGEQAHALDTGTGRDG